jgi:hypothetical protein
MYLEGSVEVEGLLFSVIIDFRDIYYEFIADALHLRGAGKVHTWNCQVKDNGLSEGKWMSNDGKERVKIIVGVGREKRRTNEGR